MKYRQLYETFISKCKKDHPKNDAFLTIHHILPRSMGGEDTEKNRVYMTPKEHYIAHRLLAKCYKKKTPEIYYLLNSFASGMKGQDCLRYSNLNFYIGRYITMKSNKTTKQQKLLDAFNACKIESEKLINNKTIDKKKVLDIIFEICK